MKIIASDFDGTLQYNGRIAEKDLAAIARFRAKGHKFGLVTGRGADDLACMVHLPVDFIICATGAVILDEQKRVIYRNAGILGDYMAPIIARAREWGCSYFRTSSNFSACDIENGCEHLYGREFEQCNTHFANHGDALRFTEYVNMHFSEHIAAFMNGTYLDMPPAGNSKVSGILAYAKQFADPEIYTVGDNYNDIPMIEAFHGIAVENAVGELIARAKYRSRRIVDAIAYVTER